MTAAEWAEAALVTALVILAGYVIDYLRRKVR